VHGEEETRSQLFHSLNGFEAFLRLRGETVHAVHQQVGIGLVVRTADAAAQLVQLREAEAVGTVHDDSVGRGHIDAGFNNRGAQQHVESLVVKIAHYRFQIALVHLSVCHADARFRQ